MDTAFTPTQTSLRLGPFDPRFAGTVAGWVRSDEELRWLAPSTRPPLTAPKVIGWKRPAGCSLMLTHSDDPTPIGYAELNPMRKSPGQFWLGHVAVDPHHRGCGVGQAFVRTLLSYAFDRLYADRVSLIVFPENSPAIRCYLRAGFTLVSEEHHRFGGTGPLHRLLRLEAGRSDWERQIHSGE